MRRRRALPIVLAAGILASTSASVPEVSDEQATVLDEAWRLAEAGRVRDGTALLEERAREWSEAGRLADAEAALGLAVELAPGDGPLRLQLGRLLMLEKRHAAALEHLERAAELGLDGPALLFHLGSAQWETGDIEAAATTLDAAVEASGRSPLAVHQLGRLELWRGRAERAVDLLGEVAATMPEALELEIRCI